MSFPAHNSVSLHTHFITTSWRPCFATASVSGLCRLLPSSLGYLQYLVVVEFVFQSPRVTWESHKEGSLSNVPTVLLFPPRCLPARCPGARPSMTSFLLEALPVAAALSIWQPAEALRAPPLDSFLPLRSWRRVSPGFTADCSPFQHVRGGPPSRDSPVPRALMSPLGLLSVLVLPLVPAVVRRGPGSQATELSQPVRPVPSCPCAGSVSG